MGDKQQPKPSEVMFPFNTGFYGGLRSYFDSEDIIAGLSLPLLESLMSESVTWKEAVKGFLNQIISRNIVTYAGPTLNVVTQHSIKSLVAGALLPIEDALMRRSSYKSETFFRKMSKGTVASLIAGSIGPTIGDLVPAYL